MSALAARALNVGAVVGTVAVRVCDGNGAVPTWLGTDTTLGLFAPMPVSYTHLTLPTICSV